jgi:hypothetical protein
VFTPHMGIIPFFLLFWGGGGGDNVDHVFDCRDKQSVFIDFRFFTQVLPFEFPVTKPCQNLWKSTKVSSVIDKINPHRRAHHHLEQVNRK